MRKEVVLAISIGLILGLIITFGVYTANQATKGGTDQTPTPTTNRPSPTPESGLVTITSPQDGDILSQSAATISGQVKSDTQLFILTETDDIVVDTTNGQFNQTIRLINGANLIRVIAIQGDTKQEISLNLLYSTIQYDQ